MNNHVYGTGMHKANQFDIDQSLLASRDSVRDRMHACISSRFRHVRHGHTLIACLLAYSISILYYYQ